jgi:hypothetical protein
MVTTTGCHRDVSGRDQFTAPIIERADADNSGPVVYSKIFIVAAEGLVAFDPKSTKWREIIARKRRKPSLKRPERHTNH